MTSQLGNSAIDTPIQKDLGHILRRRQVCESVQPNDEQSVFKGVSCHSDPV